MLVDVQTQQEMEAALAAGNVPRLIGAGWFYPAGTAHVVARESAHVVARESAHVEARESAHIEAWGSAHVVARESAHVEAWGSAHVEAWGSAHVVARESAHIEAWGSAHVRAFGAASVLARGSATIIAAAFVAVTILSGSVTVTGGIQIRPPEIDTGSAWCEFYGVEVKAGVAVLFKAVDADWKGGIKKDGVAYKPGTKTKAPDWDGGAIECGGGLHFAPTPAAAAKWRPGYEHLVACPVKVADIAAHGHAAIYPDKCKARAVSGAIYEVDLFGKRLRAAKPRAKKVAA